MILTLTQLLANQYDSSALAQIASAAQGHANMLTQEAHYAARSLDTAHLAAGLLADAASFTLMADAIDSVLALQA